MCSSNNNPIRIILIILCIGSKDCIGMNVLQTQDDGIWRDDTQGSFGEHRKGNLRQHQPSRSSEQSILRNLSLWGDDSNVWGSMLIDKELGAGWIPASYPNPKVDPGSCGISIDDGEDDHDVVDLPKLYFCDPDRVLSNRNIGRITSSLRKFNSAYGGVHSIDNPEIPSTGRWMMSQEEISPLDYIYPLSEHLNESYYKDIFEEVEYDSNSFTQISSAEESRIDLEIPHQEDSIESANPLNERNLRYEATIDDDFLLGPTMAQSLDKHESQFPDITVGIAIAQKIDVTDILREYSFYSFEDEVDTINDAAEYFARYLLNLWWRHDTNLYFSSDSKGTNKATRRTLNSKTSGILIFMAVEEQVCFVAAGSDVSYILPWWRLESIVDGMKANLRNKSYGDALLIAIDEIAEMLTAGPPTSSERAHDFLTRFGIIIAFSLMTFFVAIGGEYRERHRRLASAELRSRLNSIEEEKAKLLQQEFKATECPICLEPFNGSQDSVKRVNKVDKYGIPCRGTDGLPIKLLRCGHIYDRSCWQAWIEADYGNSDKCPVCRQDVAGSLHKQFSESDFSSDSSLLSVVHNDSLFSDDDTSVDNDESEALIPNARMFSFEDGVEYERPSHTRNHSYGSTWNSRSSVC